jgi:hypothetical protein
VLHEIVFYNSNKERNLYRSEITQSQANRKVAIAALQYQAYSGSPPLLLNDLLKDKFLEKRDYSKFYLSEDTDDEKEESSD